LQLPLLKLDLCIEYDIPVAVDDVDRFVDACISSLELLQLDALIRPPPPTPPVFESLLLFVLLADKEVILLRSLVLIYDLLFSALFGAAAEGEDIPKTFGNLVVGEGVTDCITDADEEDDDFKAEVELPCVD